MWTSCSLSTTVSSVIFLPVVNGLHMYRARGRSLLESDPTFDGSPGQGSKVYEASTWNSSVTNVNITTQSEEPDYVANEAGAIVGVIFAVIVSLIMVGIAVYFLYYKRRQTQEYSRTAKVQTTSARNAGVYMDTTTEESLVPPHTTTSQGAAYKSLQKNQNVYDYDSDDDAL